MSSIIAPNRSAASKKKMIETNEWIVFSAIYGVEDNC